MFAPEMLMEERSIWVLARPLPLLARERPVPPAEPPPPPPWLDTMLVLLGTRLPSGESAWCGPPPLSCRMMSRSMVERSAELVSNKAQQRRGMGSTNLQQGKLKKLYEQPINEHWALPVDAGCGSGHGSCALLHRSMLTSRTGNSDPLACCALLLAVSLPPCVRQSAEPCQLLMGADESRMRSKISRAVGRSAGSGCK